MKRFYAISGSKIKKRIKLYSTFSLIPWEEVPDCDAKRRPSFDPQKLMSIIDSDNLFVDQLYPTAAVEANVDGRLELLNAPPTIDERPRFNRDFQLKEIEMMETTAHINRCIFFASDRPSSIMANWTMSDNIESEIFYKSQLHLTDKVFNNPFTLKKEEFIDESRIKKFYNEYKECHKELRDAIKIAIDRLIDSYYKVRLEDRFIDIGIALEILLLHNIEKKTELSYRMKVRGALFIGGGKENKKKNFKEIDKIYSMRSAAAHNGKISVENGINYMNEAEKKSLFVSDIAKRLISFRKFPDWENEIILS